MSQTSIHPCELPDADLLRQCVCETFRASGPGGQHRNKTDSAVRLTHSPSDIHASANESRSEHENRAAALNRLRVELALTIRSPFTGVPHWWPQVIDAAGKPRINDRNPLFPQTARLLMDSLEHYQASTADAAQSLGMSTSALITTLAAYPRLWAAAQSLRRKFGHHLLANPRK